jgi:hypothetical protein
MANSFPLLVLILAALAAPAAVRAQSATGESQVSPPSGADRLWAIRPLDGTDARMIRRAVLISDLRADQSRRYLYADTARTPADSQPPTAIDYRFAPEGLVGFVGYSHDPESHPIDEAGLAATRGFGRQGGFLGASLHYDFK